MGMVLLRRTTMGAESFAEEEESLTGDIVNVKARF
jgi:hypothetical protein